MDSIDWKIVELGKPDSTGSRLMVSHIGMSSIGISIGQLLAHDDTSVQEITHFQLEWILTISVLCFLGIWIWNEHNISTILKLTLLFFDHIKTIQAQAFPNWFSFAQIPFFYPLFQFTIQSAIPLINLFI